MTLIDNYILKLRYRINDRNSKVYTDAELQLYLEDGVYSLQGTGYFRKFTVINVNYIDATPLLLQFSGRI